MKERTVLTATVLKRKGTFAWMWDLGARERRVFGACVGGWALDAMDVQMFSFVIPALIVTWGITRGQAGVLLTAALLMSDVGGWHSGCFADRCGRARSPQIAFPWSAVLSFYS